MVVGANVFGYDMHRGNIPADIMHVDFHDEKFLSNLQRNQPEEGDKMFDMLVCLSLCHGVIIEEDESGNKKYNASSPDELAFINMAKYCKWEYLGINDKNELCVQTPNRLLKYQILHTIEFDSNRKRMSVILEKEDRIYVYCKGADNVIMPRLRGDNNDVVRVVDESIDKWSREGLRTLLFTKREIEKKDYEKWAKMYARSLVNL